MTSLRRVNRRDEIDAGQKFVCVDSVSSETPGHIMNAQSRTIVAVVAILVAMPAITRGADEADHKALIDAIRNGTDTERYEAAVKLGALKEMPESVVNSLMDLFSDRGGSTEARLEALNLIQSVDQTLALLAGASRESRLEPHGARLSEVVRRRSESIVVRQAAAGALLWTDTSGGARSPAGVALLPLVKDKTESPEMRLAAATTICASTDLVKEGFESVLVVIGDKSESAEVRSLMFKAVGLISLGSTGKAPEALRRLFTVADDRNETIQLRASALDSFIDVRIGLPLFGARFDQTDIERYSTRLVVMLADGDEHQRVRSKAGSALRVLPRVDPKVIPDLIRLLESQAPDSVHADVAEVLGEFGAKAKPALPALEQAWREKSASRDDYISAAKAIREIEPEKAKSLGIPLDDSIDQRPSKAKAPDDLPVP